MSFLEDSLPVIWSGNIRGNILFYSDLFQQKLSQSMSNTVCGPQDEESERCRDADYALILKMVAIAAILTAGVCGVAIPLLGKKRRFLRTDSYLFVTAKAFAAGVILATGFVHMLKCLEKKKAVRCTSLECMHMRHITDTATHKKREPVKGVFQSIHTVIPPHMGLDTEMMTRELDTLLFHRFWNLGLCHIL